jgi:lipid-A-disaccharide synthase
MPLGGGLMRALKNVLPDVEFHGVGGGLMINEGLQTLFPMHELSVMGVAEVLPKLFGLMKRIDQTSKEILRLKPDAVISIDSPDFCFRVIKKVKEKTKAIPCIHYVAPSVWAWRPGRAKDVSTFLDHVLTLLPFEPPYFTEHGLGATFVGHPIVERHHVGGNGERFRQKYGLKADQPVLCMLPGSRM